MRLEHPGDQFTEHWVRGHYVELVRLLDVDGEVGDRLPAVLQHRLGLVIAHGLTSPDSMTTHDIDLGYWRVSTGTERGSNTLLCWLLVVWAWAAQNILVTVLISFPGTQRSLLSLLAPPWLRHVTLGNGGSWSWHEWVRTLKTHFGVNNWWDYWTFIFNWSLRQNCTDLPGHIVIIWDVLETPLLLMQQGRCQQWIEQKLYKSHSSALQKEIQSLHIVSRMAPMRSFEAETDF